MKKERAKDQERERDRERETNRESETEKEDKTRETRNVNRETKRLKSHEAKMLRA